MALAKKLYAMCFRENPGLREDYYHTLVRQFEIGIMYCEQFRCVANVFFCAEGREALDDRALAEKALHELRVFEQRLKEYRFPVFAYPGSVLLCYEKLHYFRLDAERVIAELYA